MGNLCPELLGCDEWADGFDWSLVWPALMLGWCMLRVAKALSMKLILSDNGIEYRKWFRTHLITLEEISSLTSSRWDGGWLYAGGGPKRIRVLEVRRRKSEGEVISLDFAFMPQKDLDELVSRIRSCAGHNIRGYKPSITQTR